MYKKKLLIALMLLFATACWAYNHSEVSPSGHTLYYQVNTSASFTTIVYPNTSAGTSENPWSGFISPQGHLIIPDSITYNGTSYPVVAIGERAFQGCGITSVIIPESVLQLGNQAFSNCFMLDSVIFCRIAPPVNIDNAFEYSSNAPIFYIPCGTYNNYRYIYGLPTPGTPCLVFGGNLQEPNGPDFNMTVMSNNEIMGTAAIRPSPGNSNIRCDSTVVVYATSNSHYHFSHWSNGRTLNPDTLHLVGDSNVTAFFEPNEYPLIVRSSNESVGMVSGGGTYAYLDTATVYATANEHYHFVIWRDSVYGDENGIVYEPSYAGISTDNPRHWVVDNLMIFTAFFAIDTHSVNIASSDIAHGRVEGGGLFEYGTPCTVSAEAYSGYHFDHWSNGATYNPYTFAVLEDTELTAVFLAEGEVGIEDIMTDDINVYSYEGHIVVEGTTDEVRVFDMVGRNIRNETLPAGVYMVKIGNHPTRKVVVIR